jgi:hypothetical protein
VASWLPLGLGLASALVILADEFVVGNRQHMWVMNVVHPVTALYWGPVWVWAYIRNGRKSGFRVMKEEAQRILRTGVDVQEWASKSTSADDLRPWHIGNAVSHCGAGCTLGDIAGEWMLFAVFGSPLLGVAGTYGWEIVADFAFAWTLGVVFQYFTIVPMGNAGKLQGIWQAVKVDTLSIVAFQLGLFGWMAISHFVLFSSPLPIDTSSHWFMMQVGMILGFFTAWPVNRWLVRSGVKEKMDDRAQVAEMAKALQLEPCVRGRNQSTGARRSGSAARSRAG